MSGPLRLRHFAARALPWLALVGLAGSLLPPGALADPMRPLGGSATGSGTPPRPAADGSLRPVALPPPAAQRTPIPSPTAAASAPSPGAPLAPPVAAGQAPEADSAPRAADGTRLTALRQDSQGQWHALFGDQWLTVGARLGAQSIAAIDALSVQLRQGRQTQTLHLLPQLVPSVPASAAAASGPASGAARTRSARARAAPSSVPTAARQTGAAQP